VNNGLKPWRAGEWNDGLKTWRSWPCFAEWWARLDDWL